MPASLVKLRSAEQTGGQAHGDSPGEITGEWQSPPSLPLYFAAFVISICGLYAVNMELDDPPFALMTEGLVLLGFVVSYISRKYNISSRAVEVPAVILCTMLALVVVVSNEIPPFLAPAGAGADRNKSLALLLTWLVVLRSFTLVSDGHLLFCCVPTIAMMGLIATSNNEPELLTAFIVFLCAAAFMMVHENYLRTKPAEIAQASKATPVMLFGSQLQMTAFCALGAALIANVIATPLQNLGVYVVPVGIYPQNSANRSSSPLTRTIFSESREVRVAAGPVKLGNQIVMHVRADMSAYWRGTTFDFYTGHGWRDTVGGEPREIQPDSPAPDANVLLNDSPPPYVSSMYHVPINDFSQVGPKHHELHQVVRLEPGAMFKEVYAASEPRAVRIGGPISGDRAGSIHVGSTLVPPLYEVWSQVPDSDPTILRRAPQDYSDNIRRFYLQQPENSAAMARIREAAQQATQGLKNPYDKVVALQQWIDERCKYNTEAAGVGEDKDVVEEFLFNVHEGYCDSFAAALAVMCRSIGIPARVASGFLSGEYESTSQVYAVRERDKHQWTEVYFPTVGWVTFDATSEAEDISAPDSDNAAAHRKSFWAALFKRGWLPPTALLAFLVMLGYVLKVEVWDRLRRRRRYENPLQLPAANLEIVTAYDTACAALSKRGLGRSAATTPTEYVASMARPLVDLPEALAALELLTPLIVRYRYGRETAEPQDVQQAQAALRRLQTALKGAGRRSLVPVPAPGNA